MGLNRHKHMNKNYINTEACSGDNVPKRVGDFNIKYVATDGWRGYYTASPRRGTGWVKLRDGWVTGDWDDAPEDSQGSNVERALEQLNTDVTGLGGELMVVFLPTSNVFSTAYDVFVRGVGVTKHGLLKDPTCALCDTDEVHEH